MFNQRQFLFQENKPGNQTITKVMLIEAYSETSQNSKRNFLSKQLTAKIHYLFLRKPPTQTLDWVLNSSSTDINIK